MSKNNPDIRVDHRIEILYGQASHLIDQARQTAYRQINDALVRRNWNLGKLIVEEKMHGENRAEYGALVIKALAEHLTKEFGKGFTKTNLYSYARFYELFPNIFHTPCGKSTILLSWSHYRTLLQELNEDAREWYEHESATQG